jgi:hypothetical protein
MNNFNIYVAPENYLYSVTKEPKVLKTRQGIEEYATEYAIRIQIKDHADGEMTIHKGPDGEWKNYINSDHLFYDPNVRVLMTAINMEESKANCDF